MKTGHSGLGPYLRELRKAKGQGQALHQVSKGSDIAPFGKLESGKRLLPATPIKKLSKHRGVNIGLCGTAYGTGNLAMKQITPYLKQ